MEHKNSMLYPLMVIAALAVILFSMVGIATMTGHMPKALSSDRLSETLLGREPAKPQDSSTAASKPAARSASRSNVAAVCGTCGVIDSIQATEVKGQGSGVGIVAGGIVGAVIGNQIGNGRGRDAATVLGAVGGGYAGNEVEKNIKKTMRYSVRVRMEDGSYRTLSLPNPPAYAIGDRVRIVNGSLSGRA